MSGLVILVIGFVIYFLPAFVATARDHRNKSAICILNLLAGWTLIGWIAALVWAFTNPR